MTSSSPFSLKLYYCEITDGLYYCGLWISKFPSPFFKISSPGIWPQIKAGNIVATSIESCVLNNTWLSVNSEEHNKISVLSKNKKASLSSIVLMWRQVLLVLFLSCVYTNLFWLYTCNTKTVKIKKICYVNSSVGN